MLGSGKTHPPGKVTSIVGPETSVDGTLVAQGCLRIEGTVTGRVECRGDIIICESATVTAGILGRNVTVAGRVCGNVTARQKLELAKTAHLTGNVESNRLVVSLGAFFEGESKPFNQTADGSKEGTKAARNAGSGAT